MPPVDWRALVTLTTSPIELVIRGSVVYLGVFLLLRVVAKREAGGLTLPDLLMMVLVADASQNAMAATYRSLPEGLLLVSTIVGWNYAIDWAAHRFALVRRYTHPPPLPLIKNGEFIFRNMRKELISREEMESRLRSEGIEDVRAVSRAYVEGNGQISIIKKR